MISPVSSVPAPPAMTDPSRQAERVRAAMPQGGLFAEKEWRISPEPFVLSKTEVRQLEQLGPVFHRFQKTFDLPYRRSRSGSPPDWIAGYLAQGKTA